jgi:hypothetical protein
VNAPYVLYGVPWRHNSAGVNAIHRLVHELNERGQRAYTINPGNPAWNEPLLKWVGGFDGLRREGCEPIAIYDTIVHDNPFGARRIARWVLLQPGGLGEPHYIVQPNEVTFTWHRDFIDAPLLRVPLLETDLFVVDPAVERTHDSVYHGKGRTATATIPSPIDTSGMVTMTAAWPPTREGVAALMQETRTFYTYDSVTQVAQEALLCGCEVVLLPENVPVTLDDVAAWHGENDFAAMLDEFIRVTQTMP